MARYVDDLQLLLPIFAQAGPHHRPGRRAPPGAARTSPQEPAASRSSTRTACARCDPAIREAVASAGRALADAGHEVVEERPPNQAEVREVFESIALAEVIVAAAGPVMRAARAGRAVAPDPAACSAAARALDVDLPTYAGQLAYRLDLERAVCAWLETNHDRGLPDLGDGGLPDRHRGAGDRRPRVRGDRPVLDVHLRERDGPARRRRARRPHARRPADRRSR